MNFQKIIKDLQNRGYTQQEIAERTGTTQNNISRILLNKGSEPRWSLGDRLLRLHDNAR